MNKVYTDLSKMFSNYGNKLKKIFVTCVAIVLVTEITIFKKVIINILSFIEEQKLLFGFSIRKYTFIYTVSRSISIIIIFFCIVIFVLHYLFRPWFEKLAKVNPVTSFEKSLSNYLMDTTGKFSNKGYLISGEWGSGKTYLTEDFFDKHFRFNKRPIYKISCFGLDSRELVLKEIETQIEVNDNSVFNWVQYIPVVGLPIFGILKKTYNLQNISSDSIFIFDDFERITPSGIVTSLDGKNYYDRKKITKGIKGLSSEPELKNVDDEFKKIQDTFIKILSQRNNEIINFNLQKYNIVTGLINELIENNNVKVIIICNTDIIGNNYMDKVFRGKLDCITYRKNADKKSLIHIFNKSLENQIYENNDTKIKLLDIMNTIINDFESIWFSEGTNNLREAKSIFQAFLDTVNEVEGYFKINLENMLSLFYSIYVISISKSESNVDKYQHFPIGGHLLFHLELYGKDKEAEAIKKSKYVNELKWLGISLSGYWLLNMSNPENIKKISRSYFDYPFVLLECQLTDFENSRLDFEQLYFAHILYIIKKEAHISLKKRSEKLNLVIDQCVSDLVKILSESDNLMNDAKLFLLSLDESLGGAFYLDFYSKWIELIYETTKIKYIENKEGSLVLKQYNEYAGELHESSD